VQLVPSHQAKARQGRRRARRRFGALGRLSTDHQFAREQRRQDLLDRRWQRWRSIIFTLTVSGGVLSGAIPTHRLLEWLLSIG
jgi:hypothetical protein